MTSRLHRIALRTFAFTAWVLLAPLACAASWTGTYVASNPSVSIFVQLVQAPNGTIVGRFKQTSVQADRKLRVVDAPISATSSGDMFVGKVEQSWDRGGSLVISGQRAPGGIRLSGARGLHATLRPGSEEDDARSVAAITKALQRKEQLARQAKADHDKQVADGIAQTRAQAAIDDRAKRLRRLLAGSSAYIEDGSATWKTFERYPERYRATTTSLQNDLLAIKATSGSSSQARSKRSTLAAKMLHTRIDTADHPHIDVKQARDVSMREWQALRQGFDAAKDACGQAAPAAGDDSEVRQLCSSLASSKVAVDRAGEAAKNEFSRIDVAYRTERGKQDALLSEARELDAGR